MKIQEGFARCLTGYNDEVFFIKRYRINGKLFAVNRIVNGKEEGIYTEERHWEQVFQLELFEEVHDPQVRSW